MRAAEATCARARGTPPTARLLTIASRDKRTASRPLLSLPVPPFPKILRAAVPLVGVAICGWSVADALYKLTYAILGRDQGIFQYVAWALRHGSRDYADLHEINGPLGPMVHMLIQAVGGSDEHVFRTVDAIASSLVFFAAGASLPGISARRGDPAPAPWERGVWGLAGWAVLGAQYVVFGWWDTSQRESFYDLFLLGSIALQLVASTPAGSPRGRVPWWVACGLLSAATWFGKPTCVLFTVLQATVAAFDRADPTPRRRRLAALGAGCAAATACMLAFVAVYGSLSGFVRIVLIESPRLYTPIWAKTLHDCYAAWDNAPKLNTVFLTLAIVLALAAARRLPLRFFLPAVLLVGGICVFFVQRKAFPYHLHPASAGARLVWLAVAVAATERLATAARPWARALPVVCAIAIGWQSRDDARLSSYAQSDWNVAGATADDRAGEAYVARFPWYDFLAWDLRRAARFLDAATSPTDRVQVYGMDPYLLFLAQRLSASPYVYSFELDVDASLQGGSAGKPDADERRWIEETGRRHAAELQAALESSPPAAFVFIEHLPFTYPPDSEVDFRDHCPATWAWMIDRYRRAASLGGVRVWLRNDVYERDQATGLVAPP